VNGAADALITAACTAAITLAILLCAKNMWLAETEENTIK
jgi:hypothetical protein